MYCNQCKNIIKDGSTICQNCGHDNSCNQMHHKSNNNKVIILLAIILLAIVASRYIINFYDKNVQKVQMIDEQVQEKNNIIDVEFVDPSTEEFITCPTSIGDSKYLKKQESDANQMASEKEIIATPMAWALDDTNSKTNYVANITLGNLKAAVSEYMHCFTNGSAEYGKVIYNVNDKLSDKNISFYLESNPSVWGLEIYINNISVGFTAGNIYTFNDEYLVNMGYSGTTGPDGGYLYIYDLNGNNVFSLKNVTFNRSNGTLTYTKNCSFIDTYETATFGEIKYDTKNKRFINTTEEKSISECSEQQ